MSTAARKRRYRVGHDDLEACEADPVVGMVAEIFRAAKWTRPAFAPGEWPLVLPDNPGAYLYMDPSDPVQYLRGSSRATYVGEGWLRDRAGLKPTECMAAVREGRLSDVPWNERSRMQWHADRGLVVLWAVPRLPGAWCTPCVEDLIYTRFMDRFGGALRFNAKVTAGCADHVPPCSTWWQYYSRLPI